MKFDSVEEGWAYEALQKDYTGLAKYKYATLTHLYYRGEARNAVFWTNKSAEDFGLFCQLYAFVSEPDERGGAYDAASNNIFLSVALPTDDLLLARLEEPVVMHMAARIAVKSGLSASLLQRDPPFVHRMQGAIQFEWALLPECCTALKFTPP